MSLRELNKWLRDFAGINPTDQGSRLVDLASVGVTIMLWRNGPVEDVHGRSTGVDDVAMFRANTATWAEIRRLVDTERSWTEVADRIADESRTLTRASQPGAVGGTLADLIPDAADRAAVARHARDGADVLAAAEEVVGRSRVARALAAFGATYGSHWLGTPWWPLGVRLFLHLAVNGVPDDLRAAGLKPIPPPPSDVPRAQPDWDDLEVQLRLTPYTLPDATLRWCVQSDLAQVIHLAREAWLIQVAPNRPVLDANLASKERMAYGGWPMAAPLPEQWVQASRRAEPTRT